jgi:hypothetical protein
MHVFLLLISWIPVYRPGHIQLDGLDSSSKLHIHTHYWFSIRTRFVQPDYHFRLEYRCLLLCRIGPAFLRYLHNVHQQYSRHFHDSRDILFQHVQHRLLAHQLLCRICKRWNFLQCPKGGSQQQAGREFVSGLFASILFRMVHSHRRCELCLLPSLLPLHHG